MHTGELQATSLGVAESATGEQKGWGGVSGDSCSHYTGRSTEAAG